MKYSDVISKMTLEEKASLMSGLDFWHTKPIDRLGIKSVMMSDGPHGLRQQDDKADHLGVNESIKAVCFPAAAATAASFDRDMMYELGEAIGEACQAQKLSIILGPAINIKRSPLCGRNFEYFSEDPYLTGELGSSHVRGVQSKDIGVSVKHFFANNQENRRMSVSANADERTLREIYMAAFENIVRNAKPWTVMCAYNRVNDLYMSKNKKYLTDVLRGEWGFDGYVMTDWGAVTDRVEGLKAGIDLEMPSSNGINDKKIVKAVKEGRLDEKTLDQAVDRVLDVYHRYVDFARPDTVWDKEKQHSKAREMAANSAVLLKNDGILPLCKKDGVAFIGGFAEKPRFQGGGSSHINCFKITSALQAANDLHVTYAKGFATDSDETDEELIKEAVEVALESKTVVIFAGLPDSFESEGYDREHMNLPNCQNELIRRVAEVNKNIVVVLHNGSPVLMPWLDKARGVLEMYMGGQAVGEATCDLLFGDANPSGRLPETFPLKLEDTPGFLYSQDVADECDYREGVFVGYRYYDKKKMDVLFPFGFGLSYSKFEYSNLQLSKDEMRDDDEVTVSVDVKNVSSRAGKEVVELYVGEIAPKLSRPVRELKNFAKVSLEPGETKTVAFRLDSRAFAYWNVTLNDWHVNTGAFAVEIGRSSRDIVLRREIKINSTVAVPVVYNEDSLLGDIIADPRAYKKVESFMDKMAVIFGGPNSDGAAEEAISRDMVSAMLRFMPLHGAVNMTGGEVSEEAVNALIKELNS